MIFSLTLRHLANYPDGDFFCFIMCCNQQNFLNPKTKCGMPNFLIYDYLLNKLCGNYILFPSYLEQFDNLLVIFSFYHPDFNFNLVHVDSFRAQR